MVEKLILNKEEQLLQDLEQANRELTVLYEISNVMRATLDLDHVLYIILTGVTAHSGLGYNRALLFLVNDTSRCLEPKIAIGPESGEHAQKIWGHISQSNQDLYDLIQKEAFEKNASESALFTSIKNLKISLAPDQSNILSKAFAMGDSMHITQDKIGEYQNDPLLQIFKTNELIVMPLKARDKVNGIIIADNLFTQKHITENDLKIFKMIANQAGLAIENAQLYEQIKHKSHTDSITNLWNHGFFQEQLTQEIESAKNQNLPLCLILLDMDDFKKLNDTYGHQKGDIVLKEIAKILKESSRTIDHVCRYGGEEFSIILPQTTLDQGYNFAERIRTRIQEHDFSKILSAQNTHVTVSVGLASLSEAVKTREALITEADRAMYKAKFSGKNQTYVAD